MQQTYDGANPPDDRANALESFLRGGELTVSQGKPCVGRLIGRPCPQGPGGCIGMCLPAGCDHSDLILRHGTPYAIVTQPYGLDGSQIRSMLSWADRYGLTMYLDAERSWHFPGRTLLVMFWVSGNGGMTDHRPPTLKPNPIDQQPHRETAATPVVRLAAPRGGITHKTVGRGNQGESMPTQPVTATVPLR